MDAHAGAMVVLDDGAAVGVEGLSHWPKADRGRPVEVSGVLRLREGQSRPPVSPGGAVSHGSVGSRLVVEGPSWTILD